MLTQKEIAEVLEDFLNDKGMYYKFKEYIESKGYTIDEFGIKDEE